MGRKIRSAKGVMVDFDLLKVKEQIASAPAPTEVKTRQRFIEQRAKRKLRQAPVPIKTAPSSEASLANVQVKTQRAKPKISTGENNNDNN